MTEWLHHYRTRWLHAWGGTGTSCAWWGRGGVWRVGWRWGYFPFSKHLLFFIKKLASGSDHCVFFPLWKHQQAQTLTVWRQAEKHHIPCVCFLNKMDKPAAKWVTQFKFSHIMQVLFYFSVAVLKWRLFHFVFFQLEFLHWEHKAEIESQSSPLAGRSSEIFNSSLRSWKVFLFYFANFIYT